MPIISRAAGSSAREILNSAREIFHVPDSAARENSELPARFSESDLENFDFFFQTLKIFSSVVKAQV